MLRTQRRRDVLSASLLVCPLAKWLTVRKDGNNVSNPKTMLRHIACTRLCGRFLKLKTFSIPLSTPFFFWRGIFHLPKHSYSYTLRDQNCAKRGQTAQKTSTEEEANCKRFKMQSMRNTTIANPALATAVGVSWLSQSDYTQQQKMVDEIEKSLNVYWIIVPAKARSDRCHSTRMLLTATFSLPKTCQGLHSRLELLLLLLPPGTWDSLGRLFIDGKVLLHPNRGCAAFVGWAGRMQKYW